MPKASLTKRFIDDIELAPVGKTYFFWDNDLSGFALKVTSKKKIFFAQARVGGKIEGSH